MGDTIIPSASMEWTINVQENLDVSSLRKKFHKRLVSRILQPFKLWERSVLSVCTRIWQVGANDPRRVIHSIKVGLALSVVSLFYFVRPMFDTFAENAMWIVMTVVMVFEFTVGATLSKGLNRSFATLLAGFLGVGVRYVAEHTDKNCERVILGVSIFVLGAASTYSRFFPLIKKTYDYGVKIFIITFTLIASSGYRDENIFKMAQQRMSTILIGCALCFAINVIVFPVWAGDDLHNSILRNMEGLAESLEECITRYFVNPNDGQESENDEVPRICKSVPNSKATEEALVNFATWEPPHGRFFFRYPWNLYERVGSMTRHYAYCVDALDGFLKSEIQVPFSVKENLRTRCFDFGRESANILRELAETVRTTRSKNPHLMRDRLREVAENLQNSLTADPELFIDTKSWQFLEKHFSEGLTRIEDLHASSVQNSEKQADLISNTSSGATTKGEEIEADKSIIAQKMCQMGDMKQRSCAFREVLPLARFSALLLETVAKLKSVIMAVEELGERANFEKTGENVNECPPSSKEIVPVTQSPSISLATTIANTTSMTD